MSGERLAISRAFGAQVMTLGDFHVNDALAKVRALGRQPGYFAPQQFDSEWNVEENRTWILIISLAGSLSRRPGRPAPRSCRHGP